MNISERYGIRGDNASEIAASVESAVREGRLEAGGGLPTVRALAGALRLSPTTVAAAYRILRSRGLAHGRGRRGTRVTQRPPLPARMSDPVPADARNLAFGNPDPALLPPLGKALALVART